MDGNNNNNPILTVVAIDKDKYSHFSVRWTLDHILVPHSTITLLHVNSKNQNYSDIDAIFGPGRNICARQGVTAKEVMVEDSEVSKAILEYINNNNVSNIVLGACMRSSLSRMLWTYDVPTIINKAAPDFCSVYVICKGKAQSVRPGARAVTNYQSSSKSSSLKIPRNISTEQSVREAAVREDQKLVASDRKKLGKVKSNSSRGSLDFKGRSSRKNSLSQRSSEGDLFAAELPGSTDANAQKSDLTLVVDVNNDVNLSLQESDEMQRLKLELKQTMDMYNSACKEAVAAKQKAKELQEWKVEEARRIEQSRVAEETALRIAELQKIKCEAAIEAAEKAQKLADMETQRRRYAEQKAKREAEEKNRALNVLSKNDVRYRKYTLAELEEATNKFSSSLKIGEGGYGPVFKAKLDHTPVAIKVLRRDASQGRQQFQQEVEVLSCMRHPNMVILLGACPEYGCLVYEFMNYGSLEDRLFRKGNTPPIPWGIRFKIAAEIATGLLFLHQAKPEPLVHRDLKPGNILLDNNYVCKISDVGLARLVPPSVADSVTQYHMTSAAGTFCYIDPEYQQTGKLGTKSDIYSLGVMLLQVITARPPMGLTHHVERAIEKGTFADSLDPTVNDWPVEEAIGFAKLALKCAELRKKDRPDLGSVIVPELNRLKELGMNHLYGIP
ncbi:hypothetical protein LIER_07422 [Lithospermum erythrorhizon]|uniref:RING-type E3 ubiquitin transferase n=1 Tax=Lithospermum erythrorhizon TaxID=34254 RepID=A0AAV3P9N6_LITER